MQRVNPTNLANSMASESKETKKTPAELFDLVQSYSYDRDLNDNKKKQEEAIAYLSQAAESNHLGAQLKLARIYEESDTYRYSFNLIKGSVSEAFKWRHKAAEQGDDQSLYKLGLAYEQNNNPSLAFQYYQSAAAKKNILALKALARLYKDGNSSVKVDAEKSIASLRIAADEEQAEQDANAGTGSFFWIKEGTAIEILKKYYAELIRSSSHPARITFYAGVIAASRSTIKTPISQDFNQLARANPDNIFDELLAEESPEKRMEILFRLGQEAEDIVRLRIPASIQAKIESIPELVQKKEISNLITLFSSPLYSVENEEQHFSTYISAIEKTFKAIYPLENNHNSSAIEIENKCIADILNYINTLQEWKNAQLKKCESRTNTPSHASVGLFWAAKESKSIPKIDSKAIYIEATEALINCISQSKSYFTKTTHSTHDNAPGFLKACKDARALLAGNSLLFITSLESRKEIIPIKSTEPMPFRFD